mgnify:CR=1 FL=1
MIRPTKAILLIAMLGLAACANPDRFGAGDGAGGADGAGSAIPGSVDDPTSPAYFQQAVGDRVFFAVDERALDAQARSRVDAQVAWLQRNPDYQAVVEGHADEQGTREYNLALGARRANAVMEYMIAQGVSADRLRFVSYGKERPAEVCSAESCYAANRRAVTVLTAGRPTG